MPDAREATLAADWLGASRRASEALHDILAASPATADRVRRPATAVRAATGRSSSTRTRRPPSSTSSSACTTTARASRSSARSSACVDFGSTDVLVVVDPIDGSTNAKRGLPHHSISIAVADGPTMADVVFGYVYDYGPEEEWTARRGEGAFLDGVRLDPAAGERRTRDGRLELLGIESADPRWVRDAADDLVATSPTGCGRWGRSPSRCARWRRRGWTGWSRCGARAPSTPRPRQLVVREAGGFVAFIACDDPLGAPLDVEPRSPIVAARTMETLAELRHIPLG